MTPRPIYRWKSFWLGVLVLVFLTSAWVRAMEGNYAGTVTTPKFEVGVGHYEGRVSFYRNVCSQRWGIDAEAYPLESTVVWFPSPWDVEATGRLVLPNSVIQSPHAHARFAHWFLMLIFLAVWLAWLAGKWRLEQKKFTLS